MRFSERYGHKKARDLIQSESMDDSLRNGLWSLLKVQVWDYVGNPYHSHTLVSDSNREVRDLCEKLWFHHFKKPLDTLTHNWQEVLAELRTYFFKAEWFENYDFIEFVANNYKRYKFRDAFISSCNAVLEREVSAYRFVNGLIARVTEKEQVEEIDTALDAARGPVHAHLRRALELLSSRHAPDYRNSIKESISAVESLVATTLQSEKGTLGQLLKRLEEEIGLHPALKTAFSNLYGYTSDEGGIRHALLESETIRFEDARFFLVVCSAFVNYVRVKVAAKG